MQCDVLQYETTKLSFMCVIVTHIVMYRIDNDNDNDNE